MNRISHFQGVSGLGPANYSLIGVTDDARANPIGVDYVVAMKNLHGSCSRGLCGMGDRSSAANDAS